MQTLLKCSPHFRRIAADNSQSNPSNENKTEIKTDRNTIDSSASNEIFLLVFFLNHWDDFDDSQWRGHGRYGSIG